MENKKRQKEKTNSLESLIRSENDDSVKTYKSLNWTGSFWDYLQLIEENPRVARNSYQRLYDMVMSHGTEEFKYCKRQYMLNISFFKVLETSLFMVLKKT